MTEAQERVAGNQCTVHRYHWPRPARTVKHHIWPKEFGGPTIVTNLVLVCDTGHYTIHANLDALLAGRGLPQHTRQELTLAMRGFTLIQQNTTPQEYRVIASGAAQRHAQTHG